MISSLWVGKLTEMERLSMISFLDNGHDFTLYTYDNVGEVPDGVLVRDGNEILPRNKIFTHMGGSLAGFGDAFRFELLHKLGGCWVDLDVVCLMPIRFDTEWIIASEEHKDGKHPNPNVIKVPQRTEQMDFGRRLVNEATNSDSPIGPRVIKRVVEAYRMTSIVSPIEQFNPVPWWDVESMLTENFNWERTRNSNTVHLWNEMWRRDKRDKEADYPDTSLYQTLKRRYLNRTPKVAGDLKPGEQRAIAGNSNAEATILVTAHLRPECLRRCLASIETHAPGVPVLIQETNGNVSWARNRLLESCQTPFALIVEEDMWFTEATDINPLLDILKHDPEILIAGGLIEDQWDLWAHDWCPHNRILEAKPSKRPTRRTGSGVRYQPANLISQFGAMRTEEARQFPWCEELPLREHLQWFWSWRHKRLAALTDRCSISHDSSRPSWEYSQQRLRFIGLQKRAEDKIGLKIVPILGHYEFP